MKRSILVIDDEPDLLQAVCGFLEDEGYSVRGFASGAEGLEALTQGPRPDLVLLDVMMPGLSGFEILERMDDIDQSEAIPVVMMSAVGPGDRRPAGRWKAFLRKPFNIDKLLATVQQWT